MSAGYDAVTSVCQAFSVLVDLLNEGVPEFRSGTQFDRFGVSGASLESGEKIRKPSLSSCSRESEP